MGYALLESDITGDEQTLVPGRVRRRWREVSKDVQVGMGFIHSMSRFISLLLAFLEVISRHGVLQLCFIFWSNRSVYFRRVI